MSRLWEDFLSSPAPAGHGAEIYADVDELAESVAAFLAGGFILGEPGLVVASADHVEAFSRALATIGWDADARRLLHRRRPGARAARAGRAGRAPLGGGEPPGSGRPGARGGADRIRHVGFCLAHMTFARFGIE